MDTDDLPDLLTKQISRLHFFFHQISNFILFLFGFLDCHLYINTLYTIWIGLENINFSSIK